MSGAIEAIQIIGALVDLLQAMQRLTPALSAEVTAVSLLVKQAQAEGRDLTQGDKAAVMALVDSARQRAVDAIANAPQS
jgi:hypothetical protein